MYQSYPHPVTVMTSFPSNTMPTHSDIKSPPPPFSPFYFSAFPSTTTTLSLSMASPVGWNDNTTFGAFMPSPEEAYSPPPPLPVMTSSAYQSPSSSNVSFEEDDTPGFFSPTTTMVAHSPCDFSPTSTSAPSFYPSEQSSQHFSYLTSSTFPSSAYCHHPPPTAKPMQPYDSHHRHESYQQQNSLCYPKHHQNPLPLARPYSCPTCPRAFARKHDLQRHIRVHTGSKPYLCMGCQKSFARTDALKRHLRIEDACRLSPEIQALKGAGKRRYRNL